ncbi:TetR/AcrR family transcriptional regulator [Parvibaculum sp.]|jgi:AcrR family transcriptional regulator|uniref:TetR/AcrR family transcriptional regulator n=1 Tax=Parvibaculum sp. TaxID=2024848 RepID=UPI002FDB75CF
MSNRDRILEFALGLMNEEGAEAANTTRIAAALGISPGNLYYHFRNREEIVRVLFETLETEFRAVLVEDVGPPITPVRFAGFYLRSFNLAWRYRFFFGGLLGLLRRDDDLAARYRALQDWALVELERIAAQLVKDGNMDRPRGRDGLRSVALNTWLIWMNWIRFLQISGKDTIAPSDMAAGANQLFDVLAPYLDPAFEKSARRALAREAPKRG